MRKNEKTIEDIFRKNTGTKARLVLICKMRSADIKTGEEIVDIARFYSNFEQIYEGNISPITEMFGRVLENMDNFTKGKSNWRFEKIIDLEIQIEQMIHDDGVGKFIPTPEPIATKGATINMKNENDECFKWCVARAFFPTKHHPERITAALREHAKTLNWKGMKFPVEMRDVAIFERNNKVSINIIRFNNGKYEIHRKTKIKAKKHINLLLFMADGKKHFCLISSMSRLLRKGNQRNQRFYYDNCLNSRRTEEALEKHKTYCESFEACKSLPPKEKIVYFKNTKNQTSILFRIYADSEAILKPVVDEGHGEFQEHIPSGFCFFTVAESGEKFSPILTRGENCVDEFVDKLIDHVRELQRKPKKPIIWNREEEEKFKNQTHCWFCNEEIKGKKVRDHCHFTEKFRGAAHPDCNLKARKPTFISVFFHNLFGYDIHHFVKALTRRKERIKCIPNNEEKYVSLSLFISLGRKIFHEIKFLDSMKFQGLSLDSLVRNLEKDQLVHTNSIFGDRTNLLSRKKVYLYDFMDSFEKFNHQLPEKEAFFSKLNGENISDEDFKHARKIWNEFGMSTMAEYHDLYLKTDVLLLAHVFENFRKPCHKTYGLDPFWYLTAPSFAWDCMLKITKVEMELLEKLICICFLRKNSWRCFNSFSSFRKSK